MRCRFCLSSVGFIIAGRFRIVVLITMPINQHLEINE